MHLRHRRHLAAALVAGALVAGIPGTTGAATVTVVASGLHSPRGIDIGANGRIVVAETGAGRILEVQPGTERVLAAGLPVLVSPEGEATGVTNVTLTGSGNLFAITGEGPADSTEPFQTLWRVGTGNVRALAAIGSYQATDPDPTDLDEPAFPTQSNPYGLTSIGASSVLITDAGNNDLLLRTASGRIVTVARFPSEPIGTAHLPPFFGIPPNIQLPAEVVPTTVAVGPDGYWYVGQLQGFPFTPGASDIWRIAPWARNATCDADTSDGCEKWMSGFTSIIGIDFGPDGSLYVAEMVKSGVLNFFLGLDDVGALYRVKDGVKTELAAGQLHLVGDVAVSPKGAVYVTTGNVTTDGAVVRVSP